VSASQSFVSTHLGEGTDRSPLSVFRPLLSRGAATSSRLGCQSQEFGGRTAPAPEGRHRSVSKAADGARSGRTIDVAPPGLSAACQIGRRSGNRRNARRHPLVVHLRFLVRLEMLWHCLTDAALDFALEDVSAGIGQAVLRGGGCGRFGTA
jgi:hypothetical protein